MCRRFREDCITLLNLRLELGLGPNNLQTDAVLLCKDFNNMVNIRTVELEAFDLTSCGLGAGNKVV
jgi:hypothetical protein